jgi:hypothetical protein
VIALVLALFAPDVAAGEHHRMHPGLVGAKYGQRVMLAVPGSAREVATVVGPFFERVLVHRWLELEVDLPLAITHDGGLALPFDLHFKKPFHPSRHWSPYLGAGPTVEITLRPTRSVAVGLSLVTGTYLWLSRRVGFDVDVAYELVPSRKTLRSGLTIGVGPVLRF